MPGSRHPNKASDEEIEQSKKNRRSGAENKNRKFWQNSKINV